jgi:biotin transport system permease protein
VLLVFVAVFRSFNVYPFFFSADEFIMAMYFICSVLISFFTGQLLFAVTTMSELKNALYSLTHSKKISVGISVMLNFIPHFFTAWEETRCAYRARSGKQGWREIICILPIVAGRMMLRAARTASAIEARNGVMPIR